MHQVLLEQTQTKTCPFTVSAQQLPTGFPGLSGYRKPWGTGTPVTSVVPEPLCDSQSYQCVLFLAFLLPRMLLCQHENFILPPPPGSFNPETQRIFWNQLRPGEAMDLGLFLSGRKLPSLPYPIQATGATFEREPRPGMAVSTSGQGSADTQSRHPS